ncbi:hypothetical protein VNO80_15032 [Phaseolus coccineus]|uniref:Uncharacterized protein n=1 Tax=Phaseolus coccineus TaxID=3886 RepID=A0AAN9MJ39_PHACN
MEERRCNSERGYVKKENRLAGKASLTTPLYQNEGMNESFCVGFSEKAQCFHQTVVRSYLASVPQPRLPRHPPPHLCFASLSLPDHIPNLQL